MYLISNLKLHLLLHSEAENSRPVSGVVNFILSEYDRSVRLERVGELLLLLLLLLCEYDRSVRLERVGELLSSDKSYQVIKVIK